MNRKDAKEAFFCLPGVALASLEETLCLGVFQGLLRQLPWSDCSADDMNCSFNPSSYIFLADIEPVALNEDRGQHGILSW